MKCPKCGFNSFEYYDSCKKCAVDLRGYKQTYSIRSLVLPQEAKENFAEESRPNESSPDEMHTAPEIHDDIFSFDLPDDSTLSTQPADDPFNFDEPVPAADQSNKTTFEDDMFGDLLESTPQPEVPSFAAQVSAEPPASSSAGTGDFDFDSFSWDDSPDPPVPSGDEAGADDFDSFFEDMKEKSSS
ncbi:MAG TPA: hypothetical protein HPP97_10230 [Desulfuromonadales bacterium]|nr:hypothetical protein [Desulfuromonadales bacterium]